MSASSTKKVGGSKKGSQTEGKEKAGKTVLDYSKFVNAKGESIVNDDGLLTAAPTRIVSEDGTVTQSGWDSKLHKPLGKDDFASEGPYLSYRASSLRERAERSIIMADKLDAKATRLGKYTSDKARKKAEKLARMREQMVALEKELEGEGVDTSDL